MIKEFGSIMSHESLLKNDEETLKMCDKWQGLSNKIFRLYQELALEEIGFQVDQDKFSKLLRKFKKRDKNQ